jgi:hypothetical protein
MSQNTNHKHAFIFRIWREGEGSRWKGMAQHVQSGEQAYVGNLDELLTFIERWADWPARSDPAITPLK